MTKVRPVRPWDRVEGVGNWDPRCRAAQGDPRAGVAVSFPSPLPLPAATPSLPHLGTQPCWPTLAETGVGKHDSAP